MGRVGAWWRSRCLVVAWRGGLQGVEFCAYLAQAGAYFYQRVS